MSPQAAPMPDRQAGLSLIEILVGISIVAVVAAAVTLSLRPGPDPLDAEADRLAARLLAARDAAIISGQPVGLVIEGHGDRYSFQHYLDGRWWAFRESAALSPRQLAEDVRLELREVRLASTPENSPARPVVWFDPAGLTEPFELRLERAGARIALAWQAEGRLVRREEA